MPKIKKSKSSVFAERLIELRKKKHLTQEELALEIGVSRSTISYFEGTAKNPKLETINKLAEYFSISPEYFITEKEELKKQGPESKLEQQLKQIKKLSPAKQKMVSNILEGVLKSEK